MAHLKTTYKKDTHKGNPKDFANVFGKPLNETHLALLNSNQYIYFDKGGEYVYNAVSFNADGIVFYKKNYI